MEKIVFLFPGQGSHFVGMSKGMVDQFPIARQTFEEANDVLGFDLTKCCFEGPLAELTKAENAQPAILVSSVAAFRVYMQEIGIAPQFCAGHSLGEYSALTCAGAIRFEDALRITRYRGKLTDEVVRTGTGAMTIIDGVEQHVVEEECKRLTEQGRYVAISCYNAPNQTVIAGDAEAVMEAEVKLLEQDCQVTPLIASAPFHSRLMQPVADLMREELKKYTFGFFKYPVISNVNAQPLSQPELVLDNLANHLVKPVQWQETMSYLKRKGVTLAIEMGAKNVMTNLLKVNTQGIEALCYGIKDDSHKVETILSAYPNLRKHIPTVVTKCLAVAVSTPNRNWNNEEYQEGVVQPYRRIQEIQDRLDQTGGNPSVEEMKEALQLLSIILNTKKVPELEQTRWMNQIIDETGTYYTLKDVSLSGSLVGTH
ncbi:ACP S-malonyltransferase [Gorillibacterium sp. sgz500922]|uniref:ACP S-malonyltransferase n=1 Tax=Gorillibacterium sp. sgz500922 TaxID=3446694 RepID=UPI003F668EF0